MLVDECLSHEPVLLVGTTSVLIDFVKKDIGTVIIDDLDIMQMGLDDLRS